MYIFSRTYATGMALLLYENQCPVLTYSTASRKGGQDNAMCQLKWTHGVW